MDARRQPQAIYGLRYSVSVNQENDHDVSRSLHVKNVVTGKVDVPSIQAGVIHGGVHVNNLPDNATPEVSAELVAGFGDGYKNYGVLPFADSKGIRCAGGHVCFGVQVTNVGLASAEISGINVDIRRVGDAETVFARVPVDYKPGRGTGPLPYRLGSHAEAVWLADIPSLGESLRDIYGEVPWLDLVMRARAQVSAVEPATGDWHPFRR